MTRTKINMKIEAGTPEDTARAAEKFRKYETRKRAEAKADQARIMRAYERNFNREHC